MNPAVPSSEPLSEGDLDRLDALLNSPQGLSLEAVDGLFCALIAGPDLVLPSEYLPLIWGTPATGTAVEAPTNAEAALQLLMRHWNSIAHALATEGFYAPLVNDDPGQDVPGRAWARGFMLGVRLRLPAWAPLLSDDDEGHLVTIPLVAGEIDPLWPHEPLTQEKRDDLISNMVVGVMRAHRFFAAGPVGDAATVDDVPYYRAAPKIGRNVPCPCGSGRKYKHCCGDTRMDDAVKN